MKTVYVSDASEQDAIDKKQREYLIGVKRNGIFITEDFKGSLGSWKYAVETKGIDITFRGIIKHKPENIIYSNSNKEGEEVIFKLSELINGNPFPQGEVEVVEIISIN